MIFLKKFLLAPLVFALMFFYQEQIFAQGDPLFAVLVGGNEVNAAGTANQGDLNGFGTATANITIVANAAGGPPTGTLCYGITVSGIDTPVAAHIHQNRAGLNAPPLINFTQLPASGAAGASSGCVTGLSLTLVNQLRATPANFYVNVHTLLFPGGALRGQLF